MEKMIRRGAEKRKEGKRWVEEGIQNQRLLLEGFITTSGHEEISEQNATLRNKRERERKR